MSDAVRVVLDSNVLLQGLASPEGPSGRCVQLALDGVIQLFLSPAGLDELREVCSRPKVIAKLHLRSDRVDEFFETIQIIGTILTGFPTPFAYDRDPDDAHYVNLALAADAKLIVSRDRDLLDLMDISRAEAAAFQQQYPSIQILNPLQFLNAIGR